MVRLADEAIAALKDLAEIAEGRLTLVPVVDEVVGELDPVPDSPANRKMIAEGLARMRVRERGVADRVLRALATPRA